MNTKLITTAVFAALFSASPVLHAQSLVGGATGNLQGAIGVGPGGLGGQDAIGRLGARDTVNGVQREVRGSLAELPEGWGEARRHLAAAAGDAFIVVQKFKLLTFFSNVISEIYHHVKNLIRRFSNFNRYLFGFLLIRF